MIEKTGSRNDRSLERHYVNVQVDVYDRMRDVYLGRLVNIHAQGLMIIGDMQMEEDSIYQLDLHLPEVLDGIQVISVGADCLWTREADQPEMYWAGFSIIDASPLVLEVIRRLVRAWTA